MCVQDLYDFSRTMDAKGIMFCYAGPISQGVLEEIGAVLKHKMELEDEKMTVTQKVFGIFVEQVQNIMNYSVERRIDDTVNREMPSGIMVLGKKNSNYFTLCGNLIENDSKTNLQNWLEKITHMDKEELKKLYKERLRGTPQPNSKGAGLGFIEMARKSSKPIEYNFKLVDDRFTFFSYKISI